MGKGRRLLPLFLAALVFLVDRLVQASVLRTLIPGEVLPVIPPVLYLTLEENSGAAFSILRHREGLLVAVAVIVIVGAGAALWRWPRLSGRMLVALGLVMGGAAGNLWDRLVSGRVVDYFYIRDWPVFNVADSAIVVGMALILWDLWRQDHAAV
jgi:signal peptidase II